MMQKHNKHVWSEWFNRSSCCQVSALRLGNLAACYPVSSTSARSANCPRSQDLLGREGPLSCPWTQALQFLGSRLQGALGVESSIPRVRPTCQDWPHGVWAILGIHGPSEPKWAGVSLICTPSVWILPSPGSRGCQSRPGWPDKSFWKKGICLLCASHVYKKHPKSSHILKGHTWSGLKSSALTIWAALPSCLGGSQLCDTLFLHISNQLIPSVLWEHQTSPSSWDLCWQPSVKLLFSHSVVSDSLRPHGPQHTRLPCPSLCPGVCSNSHSLSRWCHPTISSSVATFSKYHAL